MEFYSSISSYACSLKGRFNSQRDGILLWQNGSLKIYWASFNSQRDGILLCYLSRGQTLISVSIPNGMEFYRAMLWNISPRPLVSIPNGMEFYQCFLFGAFATEKFQFPTGWNSTMRKFLKIRSFTVSIPNGMEFYLCPICQWKRSSRFQFPTGWNSTRPSFRFDYRASSFNSQRDGILPNTDILPKNRLKVSIPNGMEFYFSTPR